MKDLNKIFNPENVAVIGAKSEKGSVGQGLMENALQGKRKVFAVNPFRKEAMGSKTFPSILDIPGKVDLAVVAVPAKSVLNVVSECCRKKVKGIIVISSGFAEVGRKDLQDEISGLAQKNGIPLIGPNCLGIIRPGSGLNASFAPAFPKEGGIAVISQSGALMDSIIDRSLLENYGFSALVSYGNGANLGLNDFLEWFGNDEKTRAIVLYLEGIEEGRDFLKIARKVSQKKPVFVLKAGKTSAGKTAAATHTGSLAGSYEIYKAVFKQAGLKESESLEEMFDAAKASAWQPGIRNGVGVVTNGGGYGVLAADCCSRYGVELVKLSASTKKKLRSCGKMNSFFSPVNPLDILGDASAERYEAAVNCLLGQKNIRGLIILQTPQIMTETEKNARIIAKAQKKHPKKAIVCVLSGGKFALPGKEILERNHIPVYSDPKRAVMAMRNLIE